MARVSVIIPVYNSEKVLLTPVKSLQAQTYKDWELILVDDGSKDDSAKLCDELAERYQNISVIHQANGGVSSARNIGLNYAKGEYVLFLDSDDWLEDNAIEETVNRIEKDDSDMAVFAMQIDRYTKDKTESTRLLYGEDAVMDKNGLGKNFVNLYYRDYLCSSCTKLFKKEIIKKNNIKFRTDLVIYEDFYFVMDYIDAVKSISIINKIFYHYRMDLSVIAINKRATNDLLNNLDIVANRLADFTKGISAFDNSDVRKIIASIYEMYFYKLFVSETTKKEKLSGIRKALKINLFIDSKKRSGTENGSTFYKLLRFAVCNRIYYLVFLLYLRRYPNK